jgi:hypothetical protein
MDCSFRSGRTAFLCQSTQTATGLVPKARTEWLPTRTMNAAGRDTIHSTPPICGKPVELLADLRALTGAAGHAAGCLKAEGMAAKNGPWPTAIGPLSEGRDDIPE